MKTKSYQRADEIGKLDHLLENFLDEEQQKIHDERNGVVKDSDEEKLVKATPDLDAELDQMDDEVEDLLNGSRDVGDIENSQVNGDDLG